MAHSTKREDWPEIGAIHIFAVDLFIAVMDAYFPATGHRIALWQELPRERKDYYIARAKAILEEERPTREPSRVIQLHPDGDASA